MTTDWLLLFAGLLGLAVGSFLNVCIYRVPLEQSLLLPGSRCMVCNRSLRWFENVPVVAWIVLRGRCRTCHTSIPVVYPLVEAFTGIMFVWATWHYGPGWLLFSRLLLGCALVVLFFIDLHHRILPNVITVPGTIIGFILSFVTPPGWVSSLVGLVIGGLIPLVLAEVYLRVRKVEGLGMGDVKMLALVGAFLGWKLVLLTLALGSFLGSAVGLGLIVARRGDMKLALPFGTFLAIAAAVSATVGDQIIIWYLGFYR
ncbi:MAG: prepilin peptidase [Acidobacteria bacterium]|nr:prepilin peptidase [Acidobacteriota bacterium]